MKDSVRKDLKAGLNIILALITIAVFIFIVPRVIIYFMPFVIGWIISCIANPLVHFLNKRIRLKRKAGSAIVISLVILLVAAALYGIVLILIRQITGFILELPDLWNDIEQTLYRIGNFLENLFNGFPLELQTELINAFDQLDNTLATLTDGVGTYTVSRISLLVMNIPSVLISIIMCLLSAYFFVSEREAFLMFFKKRLSLSLLERIQNVSGYLRKAVGGYVIAQLKIEIYVYVLMVVGFMILGIRYGILIALGIAVLDMLPFFGTAIILVPWALIQLFESDYKMTIGLLIIWGLGQLLRQFIQPKIVGDSIGVHPIPTLFFLFIGYNVGGVIGMILAVPIGIIMIQLNDVGAFDTPKNSVRMLIKSVNEFRKITKEEIEYIHKDDITEEELNDLNHKKS